MSKLKVLLTGENKDVEVIKQFILLLVERGSNWIELVQVYGEEDLRVDVSDLTPLDDLAKEAREVINDAIGIKKYKQKQRSIFKKAVYETKRKLKRTDIN